MQQEQTSNISLVDLLKNKDEKIDYPATWDYVRANKNQYLLRI